MTVNCPDCDEAHSEGEEFRHTAHHGHAAQTYYFECRNCGTVFDDMGNTFSSRGAIPD